MVTPFPHCTIFPVFIAEMPPLQFYLLSIENADGQSVDIPAGIKTTEALSIENLLLSVRKQILKDPSSNDYSTAKYKYKILSEVVGQESLDRFLMEGLLTQ